MVKYICGPCSYESEEIFTEVVEFLLENNIKYIRAGIKKYRSDPETFQGNCFWDAVPVIERLKNKHNFVFVTEVFCEDDMVAMQNISNWFQIGSRNAYNTDLLKKTNRFRNAVLYKRGLNMSIKEWVKHSEYIENPIIMCFRGLQSQFPDEQRFLPDFYDVPLVRKMLPNAKICVDVSHMSCTREKVKINYQAILQYEPDYIMVEVHPNPEDALSDPDQQLNFKEFEELISKYPKLIPGIIPEPSQEEELQQTFK